ncbi:Target of EGR1, member 1 (Nuclear) [Actinomortierella wolfii]|nr:Target of EGR1, member 1 (Nuclear) [Actinomortierella wolfii]
MSNPTITAVIPTHNQVTRDNLAEVQPKVNDLLQHATFIALDVEFTGFGDNISATKASNLQERYENLCSLAKSHALIAFGLSIFIKRTPHTTASIHKDKRSENPSNADNGSGHAVDEDLIAHGDRGRERAFIVHNFNFSMLKNHDFNVTPNSMRFLAETGVDLNQWVKEGIPYKDGDDSESSGKNDPNAIMRSIMKRIIARRVPIIVHNGFLDLIFLYQSFYLSLPSKLSMFTADLSDMFPAGIYDTKYISDYMTHERVSFLSYLFRKYERADTRTRLNLASMATESTQSHAGSHEGADQDEQDQSRSEDSKRSRKKPQKLLVYSTFEIQERLLLRTPAPQKASTKRKDGRVEICEHFALHGHCRNGIRCELLHDLDAILDHEENKHKKPNKKQKTVPDSEELREASDHATPLQDPAPLPTTSTTATTSAAAPSVVPTIENSELAPEKFHSAYFDAYMTGTVFSHQLNMHTRVAIEEQAKNRIYLIGKSIPLVAEKSSYAQYSPGHLQKSRGGRTL